MGKRTHVNRPLDIVVPGQQLHSVIRVVRVTTATSVRIPHVIEIHNYYSLHLKYDKEKVLKLLTVSSPFTTGLRNPIMY